MAVSIEDILLIKQCRSSAKPAHYAVAAGAGAALGAGAGLYVGNDIHQVGGAASQETRLLLGGGLGAVVYPVNVCLRQVSSCSWFGYGCKQMKLW